MNPSPRKKLIILVLLIPVLLLLAAGSWLLKDYAGAERDWLAWKAQRTALGDHLDWTPADPSLIPDAENFAKAPLVAQIIQGGDGPLASDALQPFVDLPGMGDIRTGQRADLAAIAQGLHAEPLQALAPLAAPLQELEEASRRPRCGFPESGSRQQIFQAVARLGRAQAALRVRALASLAKGDSAAALEDSLTILRLADHVKALPVHLTEWIRWAMLRGALQPVWEGLLDHRWDDRQLAALQEQLRRVDVLASYRLATERGRAEFITLCTCEIQGVPAPAVLGQVRPLDSWFSRCLEYRMMLEQDRLAAACQDSINPEAHRIFPGKVAEVRSHPVRLWFWKHIYPKDDLSLRRDREFVKVGAYIQSLCDQAAVACALERQRLAKGAYPASLAELSPAIMAQVPADIMDGQPLRYGRQGESYLLYSVGWAGQDEGGRRASTDDPTDPGPGNWAWMTQAR